VQTNVRSTAGQFSFVASDHRLPERASVDGERPGQAERPSVGLLRRGDAASFRPIPGRSIDRRGIPQPAVPETRSSPVSPCPMDRFGKRNREQVLRKRPNSEASEDKSRRVCPAGPSFLGTGIKVTITERRVSFGWMCGSVRLEPAPNVLTALFYDVQSGTERQGYPRRSYRGGCPLLFGLPLNDIT